MYLMKLIIPLNQLLRTLITKLRLPLLITCKWSKISPFELRKMLIILLEGLFFDFTVNLNDLPLPKALLDTV